MRMFIVDDNEALRRALIDEVNALAQFEVVGEAATQSDAVRGVAELQPDVITLDLQLADGSGLGVLRSIRDTNQKVRIIVFTNHAYPQYHTRCLAAGADYFFDKSTEWDEMRNVLRNLS